MYNYYHDLRVVGPLYINCDVIEVFCEMTHDNKALFVNVGLHLYITIIRLSIRKHVIKCMYVVI